MLKSGVRLPQQWRPFPRLPAPSMNTNALCRFCVGGKQSIYLSYVEYVLGPLSHAKKFSKRKIKTRDPRQEISEVFPGHMAQMQASNCTENCS